MILFLTSMLKTVEYIGEDDRIPIPLDDENGILTNILKYLPHRNKLVVIANDPDDIEHNDRKLFEVCESFRLTGLVFDQNILLDGRSKQSAAAIVSGASLIILCGGKCVCQARFFEDIGLKKSLPRADGIVIGISAGAMNLCETVANFPEELSDLDDPRWLQGLGFTDDIIIPHFDGQTNTYQFPNDEIDAARDYILPMSFERDFIGLPNGSYIIIDGDRKTYHGTVYSISKGKSVAI